MQASKLEIDDKLNFMYAWIVLADSELAKLISKVTIK